MSLSGRPRLRGSGKDGKQGTETMSQLLTRIEELGNILKEPKQLARLTDPELIQLRSLVDELRSALWRIEQQRVKKTD